MAAQQELLGASLEAHPLELLSGQIARSGTITTAEAAERVGQRVTIAGVRQTSRRSRTARGEMMMFLTIEDLSGMLDVIMFPDVYRRAKTIASSNSPMLITGTVETAEERDEPFLKAEKVVRLA
jgi:DNA polymerase-3 subunit alpha